MLTLPTTASAVCANVWIPAMAILPAKLNSFGSSLVGLTIGGQESGYRAREQAGGGPARSFWQFERGGIRGVLTHPASRDMAVAACTELGIVPTVDGVYEAMAVNDVLGAVMARLLLWTDPGPLPLDRDGAYALYLRLWRPGKPDDSRWPPAYEAALHALAD